ncbi:CocE/NonD family hydrolase [Nocardioides sp. R-C-SC26]|uniref:CocE/NonD family hydrolase n=1 Tax=Nocardioides sp. R-C-SC26 TaxID=2870414 RepID=UPI001E2FDDCB|nr:CocE/NonD family hydrolase [Nocardioides sp. R-C-SC26]
MLRPLLLATSAAVLTTGLLAPALAAPSGATTDGPLRVAAPTAVVAADVAPTSPMPAARQSGWTPRPAQYRSTVTTKDLPIRMDDGVVLRGDLTVPAVDGRAIRGKVPVIITLTAYNKTVLGTGGGLSGQGSDPTYLVKRGYAQLTVDVRGTGSSGGTWGAFSRREGKDAAAVVAWASRQPWSDGTSGMTGPSYMGISQLFAAAGRPAGLKALFPQVPGADVYRDVVASGGQIDVGFIPLWLGLVTGTGLVPPAYGASEPAAGFGWLVDRLMTATTFTAPLIASALLGGDPSVDGRFYRDRSPIEVIDKVKVPTFFIGGEYDLFQRGTPLLFERLQRAGVPTRMILGPWDHLEGSSGADVGDAGYGTLQELQLRWFDHYVKGRKDAALLRDIKPFTYYEIGSGRWVGTDAFVADDLRARSFRLSGSARAGGGNGALVTRGARAGTAVVPPIPVSGLCTRSANQWTAGVMNLIWAENPCFRDNALNDLAGVTFDSAPMSKPLRFQGPLNARLYTSTPTGDGMLSVAVSSVAPNGRVNRITGGWQVISHRALVRAKSRYLDGELIQAWHPFTRAAKARLGRGAVAPIDVEIFPTGAVIAKGHRLRISIQAFDVPHLLAPVPDLPLQIAPMTIHASNRYPSVLTLPTR